MKSRVVALFAALVVLGFSSVADAATSIVIAAGNDAGSVHVGSSTSHTVTLADLGGSVTYTSVVIGAGTSSATACMQLTVTAGSSGIVTAAGGGSMQVTFTPTTAGPVDCTATFFNSATNVGSGTLTGTGLAPQITISPSASVDFGSVRQSNIAMVAAAQKSVTVQNTGNADLQINSYVQSGSADYTFTTSPTTPFTLAPSATLSLAFTFDPSVSGTITGGVTINAIDPANANPVMAPPLVFTGVGTNAKLGLAPATTIGSPLNFGVVPDTTSVTKTITVSNTAAPPIGPLRISNLAITSSSTWFAFGASGLGCSGTSCNPASLNLTSGTQGIDVVCTPTPATDMSTQTATVTFTSDGDAGGVTTAFLACTGGRANATPSTTAIAFGDQRVSTTSSPSAFTLANAGNANLTYALTKSGTDASSFAVAGCAISGTVAPGAMIACNVTFLPGSLGAKAATLSIATNDPDPGDATQTIALSGNGVAPQIAGPASLAFGAVDLGQSSTVQTLTITNTGTQTLAIASSTVTAGATVYQLMSGSTGSQTVVAGGTASWMLTCTPTAQGANPGNFRIASDSFTGATLDIPLSCGGQRGVFADNPTSIDFGPVIVNTLAQRSLLVTNPGNVAISNLTATLSTTTAGYSIDAATPLPTSLAAGGSVTLTIDFQPITATSGGTAMITFAGTWTGSTAHPVTLVTPLAGDGILAAVGLSPDPIAFGDVRYDSGATKTFCVVNAGQATVKVTSIALTPTGTTQTGEVTIGTIKLESSCGAAGSATSLPVSIASGQALEVTLSAVPASRVGPFIFDLAVTTDLALNPVFHASVTGTWTSGMLTLSDATYHFGAVDVDGGLVAHDLTISNTGTAPFDVAAFSKTTSDTTMTFALPTAQTLAPGAAITIHVTFDPTVVTTSTAHVGFAITHLLGGPTTGTIDLDGRGVDRTFTVTPDASGVGFPDTFRHPGAGAPTAKVTVTNTGEAPLHVTGTTVTGPGFALVGDATATIAGGSSFDFTVQFSPTVAGAATGVIAFAQDDDHRVMAEVALRGNGLDRAVIATRAIDVGYVAVGGTVSLPDTLAVVNTDTSHAFAIRELATSASEFTIVGPTGSLPAGGTASFGVQFTPDADGDVVATATLYLDEDPEPQAIIELRGHALTIEAHGGGCDASGRGGGGIVTGLLVALGLATRRARRRRFPALAAIAFVTLAAAPGARADDLAIGTFAPVPTTEVDDLAFQVAPPTTARAGEVATTAVGSYANNLLVLDGTIAGAHVVTDRPIARRTTLLLGGALALRDDLEVAVTVPLYAQEGRSDLMTFAVANARGTALGDIGVHAKLALVTRDALRFGIAAHVSFPTATAGQYVGNDLPVGEVLALASWHPVPSFAITVNVGGLLRAHSVDHDAAAITQGSGAVWAVGATQRVHERVSLAAEAFGALFDGAPTEALGGLYLRPVREIAIGVAAGGGIHAGVGAPDLRAIASLVFTPMRGWRKP